MIIQMWGWTFIFISDVFHTQELYGDLRIKDDFSAQ